MKILVLNGPNLNLLGQRETNIYGTFTLEDIEKRLHELASKLGMEIVFHQSNHEGKLVDLIQEAASHKIRGIIINAAAYTHTSVAIHDALKAVALPVIEVHISNTFAREPFRHHSYIAPLAIGTITGLGMDSYLLALQGMNNYLISQK